MKKIKKNEIFRKVFHISASIIPLYYLWIICDNHNFLLFLIFLTIFAISVEFLRNRDNIISRIFYQNFGKMLRINEKSGKTTGATWLLIGFLITVYIFPKNIAVPAMLFLTVGDSCAAIFGKFIPFGRIGSKHISGFISGLFFSFILVVYLNLNLPIVVLLVGAFSAMLTELIPLQINDNITIPFVSGLVMQTVNNLI